MTPLAQPGNPRPRMFRYPAERSLQNALGFNNAGAAALRRRLASRAPTGLPAGGGEHRQEQGDTGRGRRGRLLDAGRESRRAVGLPGGQRLVSEHAWSARPAGVRAPAATARAPDRPDGSADPDQTGARSARRRGPSSRCRGRRRRSLGGGVVQHNDGLLSAAGRARLRRPERGRPAAAEFRSSGRGRRGPGRLDDAGQRRGNRFGGRGLPPSQGGCGSRRVVQRAGVRGPGSGAQDASGAARADGPRRRADDRRGGGRRASR